MDVIGAGFGRTGTLSLKAALERLRFLPCYHMVEVPSRGHGPFWREAMRRKARGEPFPHLNEGEQFPEPWAVLSELAPGSARPPRPQCRSECGP
jgi:hypothetical protein